MHTQEHLLHLLLRNPLKPAHRRKLKLRKGTVLRSGKLGKPAPIWGGTPTPGVCTCVACGHTLKLLQPPANTVSLVDKVDEGEPG